MRFLIVDEAPSNYISLKQFLEEEAFAVDHTPSATKASYLIKINPYDLILIGKVADTGGHRLCGHLRDSGQTVPIIGLASSVSEAERLDYLLAGADDCLSIPYSFRELIARIRAVLRRGPALREDVLRVAGIVLNCRTQRVRAGGRLLALSKKEFSLLELLMRNKGGVVTRSVILEHVWDSHQDPFSNTVEAHICTLRQKLGPRGRKAIQNIQGRGYLIDP